MTSLVTDPNITDGDVFYEALIAMHRELTDEQSALVNARLILLLANHIGDYDVLREAMRIAREEIKPSSEDEPR